MTDKAPTPIGPYSAARSFGDFVFISGQIGIDPSSENQDLVSNDIG
jgi:2-iminobutanoate/2-iminopropanoate deaminase